MKKITERLNSPKKIAAFVICVMLIVAALCFATLQVGANVNANKTIGMDKGVDVALADAGFKSEEVANLVAHYDSEDGVAVYEVEFTANGFEYDYTVKASDGTIIEADKEKIQVAETVTDTADKTGKTDKTTESSNTASNSGTSQSTTTSTSNPSSKYIGVDKAKSIALKDAGVSASSVIRYDKAKLDREDGVTVYEIEFYTDSMEYEYEINATTGKIMDKDAEMRDYDDDDDWDDEWDD